MLIPDKEVIYKLHTITCNAKREVVLPALGHNWDYANPVSDTATCSNDGTVTYKCADSGCTAETSEPSPAKGHRWAEEWSKNETYHWLACTNSYCEISATDISQMSSYNEHYYENKADATCDDCGYVRTLLITEATADMTIPQAGDGPDALTFTVPDEANYTVEFHYAYLWESPYPHVADGATFVAGKTYAVRVTFTPAAGYVFASDVEFTIY